jgi:hypothetical protein
LYKAKAFAAFRANPACKMHPLDGENWSSSSPCPPNEYRTRVQGFFRVRARLARRGGFAHVRFYQVHQPIRESGNAWLGNITEKFWRLSSSTSALSKCTYLNQHFWNERTDLNLPFGNERISRNSFGNERISRYSFRNERISWFGVLDQHCLPFGFVSISWLCHSPATKRTDLILLAAKRTDLTSSHCDRDRSRAVIQNRTDVTTSQFKRC